MKFNPDQDFCLLQANKQGRNLQLKSFQCSQFASDETLCFQASLWIDGEKIGDVANGGQGGSHRWGISRDQLANLETYAESLGDWDCNGKRIPYDADLLVSIVAQDAEYRNFVKRNTRARAGKNRLLFIAPSFHKGEFAPLDYTGDPKAAKKAMRDKYGPDTIFYDDDPEVFIAFLFYHEAQ